MSRYLYINCIFKSNLFDSGKIQPKGFIEYVTTKLFTGNYTFYTITDPTITAQVSILQK